MRIIIFILLLAATAFAEVPCAVECDGSPKQDVTTCTLYRNASGCRGECGYTIPPTYPRGALIFHWCPTITKNGVRYGPELVCEAPATGNPSAGCQYDPAVYQP